MIRSSLKSYDATFGGAETPWRRLPLLHATSLPPWTPRCRVTSFSEEILVHRLRRQLQAQTHSGSTSLELNVFNSIEASSQASHSPTFSHLPLSQGV